YALRNLHSFPTRRSSDLRKRFHGGLRQFVILSLLEIGLDGIPVCRLGHKAKSTIHFQDFKTRCSVPVRFDQFFQELVDLLFFERSEEHTSELQSRENLVC